MKASRDRWNLQGNLQSGPERPNPTLINPYSPFRVVAVANVPWGGRARAGEGMNIWGHRNTRNPLDHDTRRSMYEIIRENPGIATKDIAQRLNIRRSGGKFQHHAGILLAAEMVFTERDGQQSRWWPAGMKRDLTPAVKHDLDSVFDIVRDHPQGVTRAVVHQIIQRVSIDTVTTRLERLVALGRCTVNDSKPRVYKVKT